MLLVNASFKIEFLVACTVKREIHVDCGEIVGLKTFIRHGARVSCSEACVIYVLEKQSYLSLLAEEHPRAARILNLESISEQIIVT